MPALENVLTRTCALISAVQKKCPLFNLTVALLRFLRASGKRRAASGNGNDQGCGKGQNPDFLHNFAKNKPILKIQTAILLKISQAIGL